MDFDFIIDNAKIFDGTGRLPYYNSVGILGDRIKAIGRLESTGDCRRIDAEGLSLSPGFIDVHSHADMAIHYPDHGRLLEPLVRQGITTFVGGNCGVSLAPVSEKNSKKQFDFFEFLLGKEQDGTIKWKTFGGMLETFEKQGVLLNCAVLAPHGMIRLDAMSDKLVPADMNDIALMRRSLSQCLEQGAIGLSTGLMYYPGLASNTRELVELGKTVHDYNGVFTSHMRSYNSDTISNALDEVLQVCTQAQVRVQISHLLCIPNLPEPVRVVLQKAIMGMSHLYRHRPFSLPNASLTSSVQKKIASMKADGWPLGFDAMPTSAGFTHLVAYLPPWCIQGTLKDLMGVLADKKMRKKIRNSIETGTPVWPHTGKDQWAMNTFKLLGYGAVSVMSVAKERNKKYLGKTFVEIGEMNGTHPFDAVCDLALDEECKVLTFTTGTFPGDEFMEIAMKDVLIDPNASIVTDTIMLGFGIPSHLFYDCFPKFIATYARDKKFITVEEAIRKCTSLPAEQLQIKNRGKIEEGYYADMVLFDLENLKSNSTPQKPDSFPDGIRQVFINGKSVVDSSGTQYITRHGRVLRRDSV